MSGDFDGDSRGDIALTGGFSPNGSPWTTVPVAFSPGPGSFWIIANKSLVNFALFATQNGAKPVSGDFNADNRDDIALIGGFSPNGAPWGSIPIAFSNGDGSFNVTNLAVADFGTFATHSGAKSVSGDFNADGKDDIALVGGSTPSGAPWGTIPVAFSNGNGSFNVTNLAAANFGTFATQGAPKPVAGDFNADGRGDIALIGGFQPGGAAWVSIPIAYANGNGTFNIVNVAVPNFGTYAIQNGAKPVSGDFNNDGRGDIALTGGSLPGSQGPWTTIPVAFSNANGTFSVTNQTVASFPLFATQANAKPVGAG